MKIFGFRYLPTPLNLTALYYIIAGIASYVNMDWGKAELGGIEPFLFWGIAIISLVIDFLLQATLKKFTLLMYLIEILLLLVYLNWLVDIGEIESQKLQAYFYISSLLVSVAILTLVGLMIFKKRK